MQLGIPSFGVSGLKVYFTLSLNGTGLDILRLALLNKSGCKHFVGDEDSGKVFVGELLAFAVYDRYSSCNLYINCVAECTLNVNYCTLGCPLSVMCTNNCGQCIYCVLFNTDCQCNNIISTNGYLMLTTCV